MKHFYVFNLNKYKRPFLLIAIIALVVALFIVLNPTRLISIFQMDEQTALTKGNKNENNIALTFNISWGEEKVYDILKVLHKHKVRATFFVSGEWAERHPQIMEEISEEGHEIGMLGYRYKNYLEFDLEQIRKDISYAKEVFNKLGYQDMKYMRSPSGHFNEEMDDLVQSLGLEMIHWSINPRDWENPGIEEIANFITEEASSGDIVLLHASDSAKQTAKALEEVLPVLQKDKFSFVTISELINDVSSEEKLVE